jgi:hypothetical protein
MQGAQHTGGADAMSQSRRRTGGALMSEIMEELGSTVGSQPRDLFHSLHGVLEEGGRVCGGPDPR